MPLFPCARCRCLDNTAHAPQGARFRAETSDIVDDLCTSCLGLPWHDAFPRIEWDYATHGLPRGGILRKEDEPAVPRCRALVLWVIPDGESLFLNRAHPIVRSLMHVVRDHYLPRPT